MDLDEIRKDIDIIDKQILELYTKRVQLGKKVAQYKLENGMEVYQSQRERQILDKVRENSPDGIAGGAELLFTELMDLSKCYQQKRLTQYIPIEYGEFKAMSKPKVACPGTMGSNSETAVKGIFNDKCEICYCGEFDDVFESVENGTSDYGVVPIENSTAGDVSKTFDLMAKYNFYICQSIEVPIGHVLAAKNGVTLDMIKSVFSHEQAIKQCSDFLSSLDGVMTVPYQNTATAAKMVSENQSSEFAAICSESCAELYGLNILKKSIANGKDNFTRFICISKKTELSEKADNIFISLSLAHTSGTLYRMLTRFSFYGLNLTKIESKPVPLNFEGVKQDNFDVIFYLEFTGSIRNPSVVKLLTNLEKELKYFKFLGNYENTAM